MEKIVFLKDMSWPEVEQRLKETDIALLPVGQIEQHGPHLPLDIDNYTSTGIAERVAYETFDNVKPVVAPTIPFGYSDLPAFNRYPGTITLEPDILIGVYRDVALSLVKMGFKKIIFINGHGPNPPFINEAIRQTTKKSGAFIMLVNLLELIGDISNKIFDELGKPPVWGHACLIETSVSEVFGAKVRAEKLTTYSPKPFPKELRNYLPKAPGDRSAPPGFIIPWLEQDYVMNCLWHEESSGVKGDPHGHSKEIGERIIAEAVKPIVKLVRDIKDFEVQISINC